MKNQKGYFSKWHPEIALLIAVSIAGGGLVIAYFVASLLAHVAVNKLHIPWEGAMWTWPEPQRMIGFIIAILGLLLGVTIIAVCFYKISKESKELENDHTKHS